MWRLEAGDNVQAEFWFERALKVNPGFRPAWENLKRLDRPGK